MIQAILVSVLQDHIRDTNTSHQLKRNLFATHCIEKRFRERGLYNVGNFVMRITSGGNCLHYGEKKIEGKKKKRLDTLTFPLLWKPRQTRTKKKGRDKHQGMTKCEEKSKSAPEGGFWERYIKHWAGEGRGTGGKRGIEGRGRSRFRRRCVVVLCIWVSGWCLGVGFVGDFGGRRWWNWNVFGFLSRVGVNRVVVFSLFNLFLWGPPFLVLFIDEGPGLVDVAPLERRRGLYDFIFRRRFDGS